MRLATFLAFIPLVVACSGSPGTFACGNKTCDLATQLCDRAALDEGAAGVSYEYSCVDVTAPCLDDYTCACLQSHGDVSFSIGCTEDSDGGITVDSDLP